MHLDIVITRACMISVMEYRIIKKGLLFLKNKTKQKTNKKQQQQPPSAIYVRELYLIWHPQVTRHGLWRSLAQFPEKIDPFSNPRQLQ